MNLKIIAVFLFFLGMINVFPQSTTNMEQINILLDRICKDINKNSGTEINFRYDSPPNMGFFQNRLEVLLTEKGNKIIDSSFANTYHVFLTIENAGVKYNNIFKTGLFGDYVVEREIYLTGSCNIKNNGKIIFSETTNKTVVDSVNYDDINKIENYSLPFTRGILPAEPLAPSLLEPIIAITSAVVTTILFFVVRSK